VVKNMADITAYQENLPDNLKDLSAFVLVSREKLTAVRAEIRAIEKLELAEEVRQQKREEARMLSDALLDAEVRIGELTKRIPKGAGGDRKTIKVDSNVHFENKTLDSGVQNFSTLQTKAEIINEMGLNQRQVNRFEQMADNKDIVEQVKAEAKEAGEIPTRGKVLDLIKVRKQREQPKKIIDYAYEDIGRREKIAKHYLKHIGELASDYPSKDDVECLFQFQPIEMQKDFMETCDSALQTIKTVKAYYSERVSKYGYEQEDS